MGLGVGSGDTNIADGVCKGEANKVRAALERVFVFAITSKAINRANPIPANTGRQSVPVEVFFMMKYAFALHLG
jgi:hypothetical protein